MLQALGIHDFAAFVLAGLLLNVTPGPDLLLITLRASLQGLRAGLLTAGGIAAGCIVHVALGALGLGALMSASDHAALAVRWLGAAWLAWIGLHMLIDRQLAKPEASAAQAPAITARELFMQGVSTNVTNPKVALFFLAFVPQFVDPAAKAFGLGFTLLGLVFVFNGLIVTALFAWLAAKAGRGLRLGPWAQRLNRLLGLLFVGLAVRLLFMEIT